MAHLAHFWAKKYFQQNSVVSNFLYFCLISITATNFIKADERFEATLVSDGPTHARTDKHEFIRNLRVNLGRGSKKLVQSKNDIIENNAMSIIEHDTRNCYF